MHRRPLAWPRHCLKISFRKTDDQLTHSPPPRVWFRVLRLAWAAALLSSPQLIPIRITIIGVKNSECLGCALEWLNQSFECWNLGVDLSNILWDLYEIYPASKHGCTLCTNSWMPTRNLLKVKVQSVLNGTETSIVFPLLSQELQCAARCGSPHLLYDYFIEKRENSPELQFFSINSCGFLAGYLLIYL